MSNQLTVVESDGVILSMRRASTALAEAVTISQTKKIVDVAAAAEIYARRQHLSEEAEQMAVTVKVEALRKLGEMLQAAPKNEGRKLAGRDSFGGAKTEPPKNAPPTLAELGLTKKESAVAQKLAAMPAKDFQQVRDGHVTVAKAIAAVDATKKPAPATKPEPKKTAQEVERDRLAEEAFGDVDPLAELEAAHAEVRLLTEHIAAMSADDAKAETLKWRRMYDAAVREQSKYMDLCDQAKKREAWNARQLARCGKAIGQADPEKIAAAVEAFVRSNSKVAA